MKHFLLITETKHNHLQHLPGCLWHIANKQHCSIHVAAQRRTSDAAVIEGASPSFSWMARIQDSATMRKSSVIIDTRPFRVISWIRRFPRKNCSSWRWLHVHVVYIKIHSKTNIINYPYYTVRFAIMKMICIWHLKNIIIAQFQIMIFWIKCIFITDNSNMFTILFLKR